MGTALELLAAVLVLVGSAQDGHDFLLRGERNRARHAGAGALGSLDNPLCGLIDQGVLIALELDADFLGGH